MFVRSCRLLIAGSLLALAAPPALSQNFSQGYEFLEAVRKEDGTKVVEILGQPGVSIVNTRSRAGEGALHIVTKRENAAYLRFLLQQPGINPNLQDGDGNTALIWAVNQGFVPGVEMLLKYGADVDMANRSGETPLIRAVQRRDLASVRLLLDAGADPDKTDVIAGRSARDYAALETRAPVIAELLANAPDQTQREPVSGPSL